MTDRVDRPPDFSPQTLRQYALIADGERGALVSPKGDIAFLCAPRWHDPAVFSSLVGGNGHYGVTPSCPRFVWGGHYEPRTLVWRSRWVTTEGVIECREALTFPGDPDTLVLLRRVEAVHGDARVSVVLDPRPGYGKGHAELTELVTGLWHSSHDGLQVRWTGAPGDARRHNTAVRGELRVLEGRHHDLVLEMSTRPLSTEPPAADRLWTDTEHAWAGGVTALHHSLAPADVHHSVSVLRGLTSSSHGMVAAATMSLPERADSGRNYDYRYAWIRDQCYAGHAAALAGHTPLLLSAADFVSARLLEHGPKLRPAYTVDGEAVPGETALDLEGYPGGSDKVGNWVNEQFQLDAFGEALLLLADVVSHAAPTPEHLRAARTAAEAVEQRWLEPDAGIWELDERQWTHSKLMCAAGLSAHARTLPGSSGARWARLAAEIVRHTDVTSLHPSGRWQRAADDARVDASLLLPGLRGAVPADDPRTAATVAAVRRDLGRDGFVYRFRHQDGPLDVAEGAFLLCGFHMALAAHRQGRAVEAVRWFERNRGAVGPPGLFTEEFDVVQRELRGNLPQAFVHALLIEAAVTLDDPVTSEAHVSPDTDSPDTDSPDTDSEEQPA